MIHFLKQFGRIAAIATVLGMVGITRPAFAQNEPDRAGQRADQRGGGLVRAVDSFGTLLGELKLTEEQKGETDAILQALRGEVRAAMQDANLDPRGRFQAIRARIEEAQGKIRDLLTDEQKPDFDSGIERIRQALRSPATQPGGRGMQVIARLERALGTLELSDEQKTQIQPILDEATTKMRAIRDEMAAGGDPQAVRAKVLDVREELQSKIMPILTGDQQAKLREALGADRPGGGPRNGPPADGAGQPPAGGADNPGVRNEAGNAGLAASGGAITPVAVGQKLPAFSVVKLDGTPLTNQALAGKPAVLIFGSYSSPALRNRIESLGVLATKHRSRASFVLIYTAEMFPAAGEQPARNIADRISVAAHTSLDERAAAARTARDSLKIKLDIAPDTMNSALQKTVGVGPNGAAVMRGDGTLAFRQDWADAYAIERALMDALSSR